VRCQYRLLPGQECVWDFDVYVVPRLLPGARLEDCGEVCRCRPREARRAVVSQPNRIVQCRFDSGARAPLSRVPCKRRVPDPWAIATVSVLKGTVCPSDFWQGKAARTCVVSTTSPSSAAGTQYLVRCLGAGSGKPWYRCHPSYGRTKASPFSLLKMTCAFLARRHEESGLYFM